MTGWGSAYTGEGVRLPIGFAISKTAILRLNYNLMYDDLWYGCLMIKCWILFDV